LAYTLPRRAFLGALASPLLAQTSSLKSYIPRLEKALYANPHPFWYPRYIDRAHGGYIINFNAQGEPNGRSSKMIVTQSRMV
jgi:mannose/cellobiose epimerase-like protein (N-acyl-D-glucosamine 2-epimerase family)